MVDERITWAAGGQAGQGMSRRELEHLIREAGRVPVERDTLYNPLERHAPGQAPPPAGSIDLAPVFNS